MKGSGSPTQGRLRKLCGKNQKSTPRNVIPNAQLVRPHDPQTQECLRGLLLLFPKLHELLAKQRRLYQSSSWHFAPSLVTLWDLGAGCRVIVNRFCKCFNVFNFHIFITSPSYVRFGQFRLNVEIRTNYLITWCTKHTFWNIVSFPNLFGDIFLSNKRNAKHGDVPWPITGLGV